MTSLITKEEFKNYLIDFISNSKYKELEKLKEVLVNTDNETVEYPSNPGKPSLENISATTEAAFQRAIFNEKETKLDYGKAEKEVVKWLEIELPVVLNKNSRRLCLDLIGALDGVPVICELKYSYKSNSDHPIYGIIELLVYYYYIHCNYEKLDKHDVHHHLVLNDFKWSVIVKNAFPKLLLVANEKYWNYWFNRENKNEFLKQVLELCKKLDVNINCFVAKDEDFHSQKGENEKYTPKLTSNTWTKLKYDY
jgi:hypothetical protein